MLAQSVKQFSKDNKETIISTCQLIGINRQVYYILNWTKTKGQETAKKVIGIVSKGRMKMPRLGSRKLYLKYYQSFLAIGVGRDKLFKILKANHLLIKPLKSYRVTTDSHHRFRKHKNLISNRIINRPEQVWVSDITYIGNRGNHRYLALITDAYSKKIVGYDISNSLSASGSIRALTMGTKSRKYKNEDLIHHSDRGIQYCCNEYQKLLTQYKVGCSMTEAYDPYENAVAERINRILKEEFLLEQYDVDLKAMKQIIKETVKVYNNERPHMSCHMKTPEQMHKQRIIKMKTYKKENSYQENLIAI